MGDLYNKEVKPTVMLRGVEIYPSTSVGEVMWAGNTLVHYTGPETSLGTVIFYDKSTEKLVGIKKFENLDRTRYEPIGIVVIPSEHDVYGTGECGVMALRYASYKTPDIGCSMPYEDMHWGMFYTNINETDLTSLNVIACLGRMSGEVSDCISGVAPCGYIPAQSYNKIAGKTCDHDPIAGSWDNGTSSNYGYIPSPYIYDGSRNPDYFTTCPPASLFNAMADFNGVDNTNTILTHVTLANWETADTLPNEGGTNMYPAACCCWRFHTVGTKQGDWYLPAMGELGYLAPRHDMINNIIEALKVWAGEDSIINTISSSFWSSSSEFSSHSLGSNRRPYHMSPSSGRTDSTSSSSPAVVIPFFRFTLLPDT